MHAHALGQPDKKLNYSFFLPRLGRPPSPPNNVEQEAANKKKHAHTSTLFLGGGEGGLQNKTVVKFLVGRIHF